MNNYLNYNDSKDVKNVISLYKKLYSFMFNVGIYILLLAIALFFVLIFDYKTQDNLTQSASGYKGSVIKQDNYLIGNLVGFYNGNLDEYKPVIVDGFVYNSGSTFYNEKSIITYKGFVLPFKTYFPTYPSVKDITEFTGSYSIKDLESYFNNFIFNINVIPGSISPKPLNKNGLLTIPEDQSLTDYFNLGCLSTPKLYDGFCLRNVSSFLNNITNYDLTNRNTELMSMFQMFENSSKSQEYCDSVMNYFTSVYTPDNLLSILFGNCGKDFISDYNTIIQLKTTNEGLVNQGGFGNVQFNKLINEYKIISMQKIIYENFTNNGKLNKSILTEYIKETTTAIDKYTLSNFYYDVIYFYNNTFLIPKLNSYQNEADKDIVNEFLSKLYVINTGAPYGGKKLTSLLVNQNLVSNISNSVASVGGTSQTKILGGQELFLAYIKRFENQYTLLGHTINLDKGEYRTKGIYLLTIDEQQFKFNAEFLFNNDPNGGYLLKSVSFKEGNKLTEYLNQVIEKSNGIVMNDLNTHVRAFSSLSKSSTEVSFCQSIQGVIGERFKQKEFTVVVKGCTETLLTLEKVYVKEETKIRYIFTFNGQSMSSFKVLNKELSDYINTKISNPKILKSNLGGFLFDLVSIEIPKVSSTNESESRIIQDRFKEYLGVNVTKVIPQGDKGYVVSFTLGKFNFIGLFNPSKNYTLNQLYLVAGKDLNDIPNLEKFQIKGFNLLMINEKKPDSNYFRVSTEEFLKQIDSDSVEKYLEFIKNQN